MNSKKSHIILYLSALICCVTSCVEPFAAETQAFEAALVIDARLTDEMKQHEVLLARARPFEQDSLSVEKNAKVVIINDLGTIYSFDEIEPGRYVSQVAFSAEQNSNYQLLITTSSGKSYRSESITTPKKASIGTLNIERGTNDLGEDGVNILLNANSGIEDVNYFKYEYEETYKIIAPDWDPFEFDIIDSIACELPQIGYEVGIKARTKQNRICYNTIISTKILQTSSINLEKNAISDFSVRFLNRDNFAISHRYSILVKQHSQTLEAFSYYQTLESFSSSDNVFSEIQPGFLTSNIKSDTDNDEKVIGYFEVTSVSEKRVYFNHEDLFPDETLPPYPINCSNFGSPPLTTRGFHCDRKTLTCDGSCQSPLIQAIQAGLIVFVAENKDFDGLYTGPFLTKPAPCGDCTKLGSNIVPDFWEE